MTAQISNFDSQFGTSRPLSVARTAPFVAGTNISIKLPPSSVFQRSNWQKSYSTHLLLTDTAVIAVSIAFAQIVRFGPTLHPHGYPKFYVPAFSILFAIAWLSALSALRTRSPRITAASVDEYRRVTAASFWTFGAIAMVSLLLKLDIARGYLAVALPVGTLGLLVGRRAWHRHMARQRVAGRYRTAVLVFGEVDAATELASELMRNSADGYQVVGLGVPRYGVPRGEYMTVNGQRVPIIGGEAEMLDAVHSCGADTVAIAGTEAFGLRGIRRLLWQLEPMGVDLVVSTGAMDVALSRLVMQPIAGIPLLHIEKPLYRNAKRIQKYLFDMCFALAVLVLTVPLLVITAVAIKVTSSGPVFYASERIGVDGKLFSMLKFRTMVENADQLLDDLRELNESDGLLFKIHDDPRVTRIGKILRRFSIDEIPQFINVVRGEMSVVGPRPPLRSEVEEYDCEILRRLLVKPGVTGLWQVSGRSDLTWEQAVRLDLSYVDNWSMMSDVLIVAKTFGAVLRKDGAY
ncbi:sugar transferase [Mycolicibacterium smegmatis]|uniref:Undecaprenyl-phosphate galactosephosphotransferase n=1 Tax=Mycolicibacterium smegmatis (strain MKD8) TaxID=1214915 RepID=A0A2U9PYD5_MYCSE|nr:sugar transferase [Mycolicibacterium smegmatis]AWT56803.1 undecaprenyl-phosphate galactosephosphotransferase [Mycolicibacterium smegmatis MKD8]